MTGAGFPDIVALKAFDRKLEEEKQAGTCVPVQPDESAILHPAQGGVHKYHRPWLYAS